MDTNLGKQDIANRQTQQQHIKYATSLLNDSNVDSTSPARRFRIVFFIFIIFFLKLRFAWTNVVCRLFSF
jgi:hypothetical protein